MPTYILLGANLGACSISATLITSTGKQKTISIPADIEVPMKLAAFPNPSQSAFTLQASGLKEKVKAQIRISDVMGRLIEVKEVIPGALIFLGDHYRPGTYMAELVQRKRKVTVKLVKQAD